MPSSDEDFESADEGHSNVDRKERKKRLSSSNYSDNALESDQEFKTPMKTASKPLETKASTVSAPVTNQKTDGWDDFEIDESEVTSTVQKPGKLEDKTTQDTGWDDFGDWGQDSTSTQQEQTPKPIQTAPQPAQTNKEAATGWGWGWSVDSLLSTATAGITNITSQVSQGISTVLETGIGAPDPEELAKASKVNQANAPTPEALPEKEKEEEARGSAGDAFQFGSLLSGVTKFVESTGTKVLAGGLDTLETIGKKTMEVLQDGDPGLAKKRAMLGLDSGDKPILSQVLREAKAKADEEDQIREVKREAKEVHYETLFDDFEGLVHLEALEMLSRQTSMRIEERLRAADPDKRQDIKETLQQVAELCEMPEDDDDDEIPSEGDKAEAFHEKLRTATQDLGLKLQFQSLIKQYSEILEWLDNTTDPSDKTVYKRCVSALAQTTALSVQTYHKTGELLLTKQRRSTADEADALTQMTVVLTKHISQLATLFTVKLNSLPSEDKDQIDNYITNVFLEAGNSSTYVQNAFQLALPILQIGAV